MVKKEDALNQEINEESKNIELILEEAKDLGIDKEGEDKVEEVKGPISEDVMDVILEEDKDLRIGEEVKEKVDP